MTRDDREHPHCSIKDGKLALPYQYFAGRVGSRFLLALRDQRKILAVRCDDCRLTLVPPRQVCDRCFRDLREHWVELSGVGTVVNVTIVRYSDKHLPRTPPYALALIKLDGADVPMAHIVGGPPEAVTPGMRVKAVFATISTSTILDIDRFDPV